MANSNYVKLTHNGYDFYEVASAFQKSIRRGLEDEALFWGIELFESRYENYCWKRMVIMSSEDVGLGEPSCIVQVMALKQSFDYLVSIKDTTGAKKLPFIQAILVLVHSRKSRYVDLCICHHWEKNQRGEKMAIPDWAYDAHTRKGKEMGRFNDFFYKESARISNAHKMPNEEALEKMVIKSRNIGEIEREDIPFTDSVFLKSMRDDDGTPTLF